PAPWTQDPDPDLDLPDVWDDRVVELAAFVEEERGMDFVFPVHVDFLTEDEFADALSLDDDIDTEQEEALEEMRESMSMFRALGWMEGGGDLVEMVDDYAGAITAAFYDAEERRITVPTTDPSGL